MHLDYYVDLAEEAEPHLFGEEQQALERQALLPSRITAAGGRLDAT